MSIGAIIFADSQFDGGDEPEEEEMSRTPISVYQQLQTNLNYDSDQADKN